MQHLGILSILGQIAVKAGGIARAEMLVQGTSGRLAFRKAQEFEATFLGELQPYVHIGLEQHGQHGLAGRKRIGGQ